MGVKDMWSILSPTCERKSLYELQGKAIAVDLSCWVVEDQSVATYSTQPRMYLRNLFFRTTCLLLLDVRPVFVLEGDAPTLKHDTMVKRNEAQFKHHRKNTQEMFASQDVFASQPANQTQSSQPAKKKGTRARLKSILKMCADMLRLMGVTCVQSTGEAEALCAQLNELGMVDGCITQDGDCFLYGAKTVYRNFTISSSGNSSSSGYSVDVYTMANIKTKLRLDREKLVALSLLCGCDYGQGVSGVGKQMAVAFLDTVQDSHVLQRLRRWRTDSYFDRLERERGVLTTAGTCDRCCHGGKRAKHEVTGCRECGRSTGCADNLSQRVLTDMQPEERKALIGELNLRKKALADPGFPSQEMIDEFLGRRPDPPSLDLEWGEPDLDKFVRFADKLLSWTDTYAVEKFLPLVTRWQLTYLQRVARHADNSGQFAVSPVAVVKKRVQKGVPCYEIRWSDNRGLLDDLELDEGVTAHDLLLSVEPQVLVEQVCPSLVQAFVDEIEAKKKGKRKTTRKPKAPASVDPMKQMTLNQFLQPSQPSSESDVTEPLSGFTFGTQAPATKARRKAAGSQQQKPVKKPQVTIASLIRSVNAIEAKKARNNVGATDGERVTNGKRYASPRVKVGFKTRKISAFNSTPKKFTPKKLTPMKFTPMKLTPMKFTPKGCVDDLEISFQNISLMDDEDYDDDDDGDFSDLSAIIDGIVGTGVVSDASAAFQIQNKRLSKSRRNGASVSRTSLESEDLVPSYEENASPLHKNRVNFELGLSSFMRESEENVAMGIEDEPIVVVSDSSSESDEFDFCDRKVVPLMERLMSQAQ